MSSVSFAGALDGSESGVTHRRCPMLALMTLSVRLALSVGRGNLAACRSTDCGPRASWQRPHVRVTRPMPVVVVSAGDIPADGTQPIQTLKHQNTGAYAAGEAAVLEHGHRATP